MTTTIKGIVRNGRIEIDQPLDLPDGTELTIPIPPAAVNRNGFDEQNDTPEEIDAWIRWYDSLEPIVLTAEERAAWETARREQKEFDLTLPNCTVVSADSDLRAIPGLTTEDWSN